MHVGNDDAFKRGKIVIQGIEIPETVRADRNVSCVYSTGNEGTQPSRDTNAPTSNCSLTHRRESGELLYSRGQN